MFLLAGAAAGGLTALAWKGVPRSLLAGLAVAGMAVLPPAFAFGSKTQGRDDAFDLSVATWCQSSSGREGPV
ncbi:hypothetical protein BN2537_215 [Streptomyces venezuelae]|nr:hypothetical protein BN2537_215 [Streptomyces venezuelae]